MKLSIGSLRTSASWISCLFILAGCHQLPDLKPFAAATAELADGVQTSQLVFNEHIVTVLPDERDAIKGKLSGFNAEWEKRIAITHALNDYADSLARIAESANAGRENAQALGQSLEPLFNAAGVSGIAGSTAFQVGTELYSLVALAKGRHSLASAVETADPVIAQICEALIADMDSMINAIRTSEASLLTHLEDRNDIAQGRKNSDILESRDNLVKRRNMVAKDLADLAESNTSIAGSNEAEDLRELNEAIQGLDAWFQEYSIAEKRIQSQVSKHVEMMTFLKKGIGELKAVHAQIGVALEENNTLNVHALVSTGMRIRTLLDEEQNN